MGLRGIGLSERAPDPGAFLVDPLMAGPRDGPAGAAGRDDDAVRRRDLPMTALLLPVMYVPSFV